MAILLCLLIHLLLLAGNAYSNEGNIYTLPSSDVFAGEVENDKETIIVNSEEWKGKNVSLADILATYPGIQTRQRGGMGSFQSISIRGMQGNQIAVAIDGVILQSFDASNLGSIDINQYEKIEIYKGYIPARFAANGMGGVINLVSKNAANKGGKFYASYGSNNSRILSMQAAAPIADSLYWTSSVNWRASDNDFKYLNRRGTKNTKDDFWTTRKNADYSQISGNHAWTFVGNTNKTLKIEHNSESGGIPGREDQETKTARSQNNAFFASFELEDIFSVFGSIRDYNSKWSYSLDGIGFLGEKQTEMDLTTKNIGIQSSVSFKSKITQTELYGFFDHTWISNPDKETNVFQASLANTISPLDYFNIQTDLSARISRKNLNSGRISANIGKDYYAFIAAGHYFREPSVFELYSSSFGILSNPDLKAEQGEQAEFGFGYKSKRAKATTTFFSNRIRDRIIYHTSLGFSKPINAEKGNVYGIEAELNAELFKWLKINSNATFQNPKDLPNEPKQQYYSAMIFSFLNFELSLEGEAHNLFYRDKAQRKSIPANSFYHAGISYKPTEKIKISIYAKNLTGAEREHIYDAFPTPGRTVNLGYSHEF